MMKYSKKGTAQWFRLSNLARNFINLSWYYSSCAVIHYVALIAYKNTTHYDLPVYYITDFTLILC